MDVGHINVQTLLRQRIAQFGQIWWMPSLAQFQEEFPVDWDFIHCWLTCITKRFHPAADPATSLKLWSLARPNAVTPISQSLTSALGQFPHMG